MRGSTFVEQLDAYAALLEQTSLEAFFHRHPHANDGPIESDLGQESDGNAEVDWSEQEIDVLFYALGRHSRLRPDLIAEELHHSKSIAQITHLLHEFDKINTELDRNENAHQKDRPRHSYGRLKLLPSAIEVSKEWVDHEEQMAKRLQDWQDVRDCYVESDQVIDGGREDIVPWDEQVANLMLFLRHQPRFDPDVDPVLSKIRLQDGSYHRWPVFSAFDAINMLSGSQKITKLSFPLSSFALDHCVPDYDKLRQRRESRPSLSIKVLQRALQLGIIFMLRPQDVAVAEADKEVCRSIVASSEEQSLLTRKNSNDLEHTMLCWCHSIANHTRHDVDLLERAKRGEGNLDQTRQHALARLANTLTFEELFYLRMTSKGVEESDRDGDHLNDHGKRARSAATDKHDIGLGGQKKSRRAKTDSMTQDEGLNGSENETETETASQSASEHDSETAEEGSITTTKQANRNRISKRNATPARYDERFRAIGCSFEDVCKHVDKKFRECSVINFRVLSRLKSQSLYDEDFPIEHESHGLGMSLRTILQLNDLVRSFVRRAIVMTDSLFSHDLLRIRDLKEASARAFSRQEVEAVLQRMWHVDRLPDTAWKAHLVKREGANKVVMMAVRAMHSDPPIDYLDGFHDARDKGQERHLQRLKDHLEGLTVLSSGDDWTLKSVAKTTGAENQGVLTAVDGFVIPQMSVSSENLCEEGYPDQTSSESGLDSLYEGSQDEQRRTTKRDRRRGVRREASVSRTSWTLCKGRQKGEMQRWNKVQAYDERQAEREEMLLWRLLCCSPPEKRTLFTSSDDPDVESNDSAAEEDLGDREDLDDRVQIDDQTRQGHLDGSAEMRRASAVEGDGDDELDE